jgi:hypothetical protein
MRASLMASQDTVYYRSRLAHSSLELPYKFTVGNDGGFERRAPPGRQLSRPNDDRNAYGGRLRNSEQIAARQGEIARYGGNEPNILFGA